MWRHVIKCKWNSKFDASALHRPRTSPLPFGDFRQIFMLPPKHTDLSNVVNSYKHLECLKKNSLFFLGCCGFRTYYLCTKMMTCPGMHENTQFNVIYVFWHIKDVHILAFYEVIANALYKYQMNATKQSHEIWFTPHLEQNQNIQAITTQRIYITTFFTFTTTFTEIRLRCHIYMYCTLIQI